MRSKAYKELYIFHNKSCKNEDNLTFTPLPVFSYKLEDLARWLCTVLFNFMETVKIARKIDCQGFLAGHLAAPAVAAEALGNFPTIFVFYKECTSFLVLTFY